MPIMTSGKILSMINGLRYRARKASGIEKKIAMLEEAVALGKQSIANSPFPDYFVRFSYGQTLLDLFGYKNKDASPSYRYLR